MVSWKRKSRVGYRIIENERNEGSEQTQPKESSRIKNSLMAVWGTGAQSMLGNERPLGSFE